MKLNVKIKDIAFGTSIQDITVPAILKKRIKTGLGYFDTVIGGEGFTPSMCTFFTGSPGAGKTTMMLSLANSLQGNGAQEQMNMIAQLIPQIVGKTTLSSPGTAVRRTRCTAGRAKRFIDGVDHIGNRQIRGITSE